VALTAVNKNVKDQIRFIKSFIPNSNHRVLWSPIISNGQASPTAKNDAANLLFLNLSLKNSQLLKFIELLSLLGACNGYAKTQHNQLGI
jgi:hypothetical protein